MLAKQLWNLHLNLNSLVARLLKAKYHPKCSILEAKIGWRPSYVWRSLLSAQDLLRSGCRWKIGSGEDVKIWGDKWVPGLENFQVSSISPFFDWDAKVSSLIDQDSRTWRCDLLELMFSEDEQQAILAIPLSSSIEKDLLCWADSAKGDYSVKFGYFWELRRRSDVDADGAGNPADDFPCWKKLWKVNIPGKLKVFIWKICHNILPVGANISKRVQQLGDECPCCGLKETVKHCLVDCRWVSRIWRSSPLAHLFSLAYDVDCKAWIKKVLNTSNDDELGRFCALLWFFWKERNNFLFNNKTLQEWEVFPKADSFIMDYLEVQGKEQRMANRLKIRDGRWKKPPVGVLKLNTDAGCDQSGVTGFGCVVRDWEGRVIFAAAKSEVFKWPAAFAEGKAIMFGLQKAIDHGLKPLIVETDCKYLADLLVKKSECRAELGSICSDIVELAKRSVVGDWSFTFREANGAAHLLAHVFPRGPDVREWTGCVPSVIFDVVAKEAECS